MKSAKFLLRRHFLLLRLLRRFLRFLSFAIILHFFFCSSSTIATTTRQKKMRFSRSTHVPLTIMIPYLMATGKANKPLCKVYNRCHDQQLDFVFLVRSFLRNLTSYYFSFSHIIQVCGLIIKIK
jgi:hypothetical protein